MTDELPVHDYVLEMIEEGIAGKLEGLSVTAAQEKVNSIPGEEWEDLFFNMVSEISESKTGYFKETMSEMVSKLRSPDDEFMQHQEIIWGEAFMAFDAMYYIAIEFSERYGSLVDAECSSSQKEKCQYRFVSIRELHGRACQIFLEISCLMKNGFADAAYARWRSLYELWITAAFINKHGESVAAEFLKSCSSNDGWPNWAKAADCFKDHSGNVTITMINNDCREAVDIWKKHRFIANQITHATPQGTLNRLATKEDRAVNIGGPEYIPVGRSDYGLALPAEHAAICFALISKEFFGLFQSGESLITIQCLTNWIDVVRHHFFTIEQEHFGIDKEHYNGYF